jgi:hypothetical protein
MRNSLLVLAILVLACAGPEPTDGVKQSGQVKKALTGTGAGVTRYDSAGRSWRRLVSDRYLIVRRYVRDDSLSRVVVREVSDQRCCLGGERDTWGTLTLEARADTGAGEAVLWRERIEADDGAIWSDFYRARLFGCCDTADELVFFNLKTGGPAFHTTDVDGENGNQLPSLSIPNTGLRRFLAMSSIGRSRGSRSCRRSRRWWGDCRSA